MQKPMLALNLQQYIAEKYGIPVEDVDIDIRVHNTPHEAVKEFVREHLDDNNYKREEDIGINSYNWVTSENDDEGIYKVTFFYDKD